MKKNKNLNKCPVCRFTLQEFKEYKFLGCDFCYEYFSSYVIDYLEKIHSDIVYKGKIPRRLKNKNFRLNESKL